MDHDGSHRLQDDEEDTPDQDSTNRLGESSSVESTPERDVTDPGAANDATLPQKRKGGRKPIYATSEERKQRNRQAQAAFRERRTEYIKQLEATIKQNEESLVTLQQSHRSAADECLMLRYKNSLLERILLEKGIDVQAELQVKTAASTFTTPVLPSSQHQLSRAQLQRTALQRHHARNSASTIASSFPAPIAMQPPHMVASPQTVPTPSSHISSPSDPSGASPSMMHAAATTLPQHFPQAQMLDEHSLHQARQIPTSAFNAGPQQPALARQAYGGQQRPQNHKQPQPRPHPDTRLFTPPTVQTGADVVATAQSAASTYYPSPFQKHFDQLEHEYDTEDISQSMLDDFDRQTAHPPLPRDPKSAHFPAHAYPPYQHNAAQQLTPHSQDERPPYAIAAAQSPHAVDAFDASFAPLGQIIDPDDPMLDADPFGLTASMHYNTAYSYEQPPRR